MLRSRSACLMRLASQLTRAQRPTAGAQTQTEEPPAAKLLELAQGSAEVREMLLQRLRRGLASISAVYSSIAWA